MVFHLHGLTPLSVPQPRVFSCALVTRKNNERLNMKTSAPVEIPPLVTQAIVPEFIRLPRVGTECPFTGLKRSKLNELILPNTQNAGHPKVKSFVLRRRGSKTGVRLVDYRSLADYIRAHPQEG